MALWKISYAPSSCRSHFDKLANCYAVAVEKASVTIIVLLSVSSKNSLFPSCQLCGEPTLTA